MTRANQEYRSGRIAAANILIPDCPQILKARRSASAAVGLDVELPSSLCYQRGSVMRFFNRHRDKLVFGTLVILLLCGCVYLELQSPEPTAIDSNSFALVSSTADAAELPSISAPTVLTGDVTKDIALATTHRGLSRVRKVKERRSLSTITRAEGWHDDGRAVGSASCFTSRDLLRRLCIQRI